MFEPVSRLGEELQQLAESASGRGDLSQEVARFVSEVAHEADLAFTDVHDTLREVAFLPESEVSPDRILKLQERLAATYARDKFKNALGICQRLSVLADNYQQRIAPRLGRKDPGYHSQLFWLLEKHEGAFIYTIQSAVREINEILDGYQSGSTILSARARAREALTSLESGLTAINDARHRVVAALPGGDNMLLDDRRIADQVLRRSPWFSGSFYLAAVLLLLTALTVVAGNVSALAFPLVVAGAFAGLTIVGALQLRNDDRLSEKSFLHVIDLAMRRVLLPLSRRGT